MKQRKIKFRRSVWSDLESAADWYDAQSPGLGSEFTTEFFATVALISEKPEGYPVWIDDNRRTMLDRFPYAMVFKVSATHVHILGVVHGSRDFPNWLDRRLDDE